MLARVRLWSRRNDNDRVYDTRIEGEGVRRNLLVKWIKRVDEYWRVSWYAKNLSAGTRKDGNVSGVATLLRGQDIKYERKRLAWKNNVKQNK